RFSDVRVPSGGHFSHLEKTRTLSWMRHSPNSGEHFISISLRGHHSTEQKMTDKMFPRSQKNQVFNFIFPSEGARHDVMFLEHPATLDSSSRRFGDVNIPSGVFAVIEHELFMWRG